MSVKLKGKSDNESANASMSVRTGRECFRALTTPEAVTLVSSAGKVRASVPAGSKATADMVQTDEAFWSVFSFRFLSGTSLPVLIVMPDYRVPCWSATIARQLFGTTRCCRAYGY